MVRSLVLISTITAKDVPLLMSVQLLASIMTIQLSDVRRLLKVKSLVSIFITLRVG